MIRGGIALKMNKLFILLLAVIIIVSTDLSAFAAQTAGRDALGEFAPKFAELNDDVLFQAGAQRAIAQKFFTGGNSYENGHVGVVRFLFPYDGHSNRRRET